MEGISIGNVELVEGGVLFFLFMFWGVPQNQSKTKKKNSNSTRMTAPRASGHVVPQVTSLFRSNQLRGDQD